MTGYGGELKRRVGKDFLEHPGPGRDLRPALCAPREDLQRPAGDRRGQVHRHGADPGRDRALQDTRWRCLRRKLHDRAVARHRGDHLDERALRFARGLRERARNGACEGIPRDPRRRADPAGRCARPRDGTRDDVPGRDRRGLRQDRRDASRGDQPGLRGHSGRPLAAACLLGQLGRPARLRHCTGESASGFLPDHRRRDLDRVRQSAPPARIRGVPDASVPEGQDPDPGRDRVRPAISSSIRRWSRAASSRRSRRSATASA